MRFIIVTEQDRSLFIHRVNERLSDGYELHGSPFITTFARGHGNVHSFPPNHPETLDDQFIYIEYNQAMVTSLENL